MNESYEELNKLIKEEYFRVFGCERFGPGVYVVEPHLSYSPPMTLGRAYMEWEYHYLKSLPSFVKNDF